MLDYKEILTSLPEMKSGKELASAIDVYKRQVGTGTDNR